MHPKQKESLNLFNDLLATILTDKTLMSSKDENEKQKENENDKTLMSSNDDNEDNENQNENNDENDKTLMSSKDKNENENEDDDETIRDLNDILDEIIDKSKSFEEQIKSLKKREDLNKFWPYNDFGDKELKSKYFKIELADMSNDIDEKLFEQIFGHTLIKLTDKLINTTNKEENLIIVDSIKNNKYNLQEMDKNYDWVM